MTFFEWSDDNGNAKVSHWIWVYVAAAVGCTVLTIMFWYLWAFRWRLGRSDKSQASLV